MPNTRYAAERGIPIKGCSPSAKPVFNGTSLAFSVDGQTRFYIATSGKLGPVFSLEAQKDHGKGTIPSGRYWIDPAQMWTAGLAWRLAADIGVSAYTDAWGFHRLTIHPFPDTDTHDRGGFFIHGGTHQGSAGCIHLLGDGMDRFLADLKVSMGGLPECSILLTVEYP